MSFIAGFIVGVLFACFSVAAYGAFWANENQDVENDLDHAAAEVRAEGSTKTPEERSDLEAGFRQRISSENAKSAGTDASEKTL